MQWRRVRAVRVGGPACGRRLLLASGIAWICATATVWVYAQQPASSGKGIYACKGPDGKPILQDRRIPECMDREQEERNRDGSLRGKVKPPPTSDEQSKMDAELQAMREARASRDEAVKYDRLLLRRYPNEAGHDRARVNALERLRTAMTASERRLQELSDERKRLLEEAEFYKGRKMPEELRQKIDTNAAGAAAQRELMKQQQGQIDDIDWQLDAERERLRKLWGGEQPGTIGPVPRADAVRPAR